MATETVSRPLVTGRVVRPLAWSTTDERIGLLLLLAGSAALFMWNLGASGWANAYYSAAALAGSKDWMAFLFGSFDAGNAITVDKTPASLWIMSLSVRLFGFSSWSILVPQALEGVAAVWLLYLTVRRRVGPLGGLAAGAILALTPVATLMFRFNNPDALLTLLLVAAAYATLRGVETASTRWLVVAGVAVGFAFLAKMLQGFLIIPALSAVYLVAAPASVRRRLWQVGVAAVTVIVSAGWWLLLVVLWPAAARPYIGGSQTNSIIDLMLGYNGLGRITGDEVGRVGGGAAGFAGFGGAAGPFSGDAGWLRLFGGELGSTVSWLLPAALVALVALLWVTRRRPRTDLLRAHTLLWGGWLLVTGLVFSLMEGIFHPYYTVTLVPAIAALTGMGIAVAWARRDEVVARAVVVATIALSTWWAVTLLARSAGWNPWLSPLILGVAGAAGLGVLYLHRLARSLVRATLALVVVALLAAPATGAIATAAEPHTGAIPTTQPIARGDRFGNGFGNGQFGSGFGNGQFGSGQSGRGRIGQLFGPNGFGAAPGGVRQFGIPFGSFSLGRRGSLGGLLDAAQPNPALVAALQQDAARYRWVAATTGSNNAAGLALSSGQSVMAIGGFNGTDPTPTLEQFREYVAAKAIHYYVAGSDAAGFRGAQGGSRVSAQIAQWVADTFTPTTIGGVTVYDLTTGS